MGKTETLWVVYDGRLHYAEAEESANQYQLSKPRKVVFRSALVVRKNLMGIIRTDGVSAVKAYRQDLTELRDRLSRQILQIEEKIVAKIEVEVPAVCSGTRWNNG